MPSMARSMAAKTAARSSPGSTATVPSSEMGQPTNRVRCAITAGKTRPSTWNTGIRSSGTTSSTGTSATNMGAIPTGSPPRSTTA